MRGILAGIAAVAMSFASAQAQDQLENYAALPRIWDAELSPDGSMLATGCSPRGLREICIFNLATGERSVIPQPDGASITGFFWPSSEHLVYWISSYQRVGGQMAGESGFTAVRAVSYGVEDRSNAVLLGQYSNVTGLGDITSALVGRDDAVAIELTLAVDQSANTGSRFGDRRTNETVAYAVRLEDGRMDEVLHTSNASVLEFVLDAEGELVAEVWFDDTNGRYSIQGASGQRRTEIYSAVHDVERPDIYGLVDGGAALAVFFPQTGLQRLNLETGEVSAFVVDGQEVLNVDPVLDRITREVVGFSYADSLPRQIFLDGDLAGLLAELEQILTEDSVVISAWSQNREKFVVIGRDAGMPANYYLLDLTTGGLGLLDVEMALPEGASHTSRRQIIYPASDGLEIEAWLTLPPGAAPSAGNHPLIVLPHGGPQARDIGTFDWWPAYYASLGYAVLQPNYRGSFGRGHEFIAAGYGGFGTRMIDDIVDGARYLEAEGIARSGGYCAVGASYGGYAALMMALRDADNVACVVTFAGVTHPFALLGGRGNSSYVRFWEAYMGSRFEDRDYQNLISPMARAGEISQPVLVMHGDQDTTVPYVQMEMLERAAEGRPNIRFVTLAGEDHYLSNAQARRVLLERSGAFLSEHLPVQ
ncbi:MAG: alpha/beta fold hydrolase [Pseudomonadota bacterium]|jgi:pimeloyl-ACP methyl ester carboxylesterase|nr:alpha/beta fold hydrolase [Pseudomonadota bacterium]